MSDGTCQMVIEFEDIPRFCSDANALIESGIEPERWLPSKYMLFKEISARCWMVLFPLHCY